MRARIIAACGVLLAIICLLLWLKHRTEPQANTSLQAEPAPTNQGRADEPGQTFQQQVQNASAQPAPVAPATVASPTTSATASNALMQRALAEWQAPIDFYGKVVDENSNAVVGAHVQLSWIEAPTADGERKGATESDSAGAVFIEWGTRCELAGVGSQRGLLHIAARRRCFSLRGHGQICPRPAEPCHLPPAEERTGRATGACRRNWSSHHARFFTRSRWEAD